jgi:hypothetical protein
MSAVLLKIAIVTIAGLAGVWALCSERFRPASALVFLRRVLTLQVLLSLSWFVALYVVGGQEVTSDVPGYYLPEARAVLAGQLPYRDFAESYAPLFPYLGAGLLSLWNSGKVFVLCDIVLGALTLWCWHRAMCATLGETIARQSSILYATSGQVLVQVLLGTNQAWVAAALAASALLLARNADARSGLVQSLALASTKFLVLLFWPALSICAVRRGRWLLGAMLFGLIVYGAFAATGANPLSAVQRESGQFSSGNLPYLLQGLLGQGGAIRNRASDLVALAAMGFALLWLYQLARSMPAAARPRLLAASLALSACLFMLLSKKSFTGYAVFAMYPLMVVAVQGLAGSVVRLMVVLAFNMLLAVEPSLWFHLGGTEQPLNAWLTGPHRIPAVGFLALDAALLACYALVAYLSVRCARSTAAGAIAFRNESQSLTACSLV